MTNPFTRRPGGREPLAAKVPEITVMFWIIKVLTTGMGEAMSDFLGQKSVPVASSSTGQPCWRRSRSGPLPAT